MAGPLFLPGECSLPFQDHGLEFTGTQQPIIKDLVPQTPGVPFTGLSKRHCQIPSPSSQNKCRLLGRTFHATSRTLLRVHLFWCSTTQIKPVSIMEGHNMAHLDFLPPLESIWNYTRGGSWSSVWWRLPDIPSKPSQYIWTYQGLTGILLTIWANSPPSGQLTASSPLHMRPRIRWVNTKSFIKLQPKAFWCQEHIWTCFCLNIVLIMSIKRTEIRPFLEA